MNQKGIIPLIVMIAVGAVSASGVTVAVSQSSIPGDALYKVKQVTENVRVATAFSKKDKAKVHLAIAEEKVKEIEKLDEKGETDKITEAAQTLEESQEQALELTQSVKSEGENIDELVKLLEVQSGRQQVIITKVSPKINAQIGESLRKSLEQFREELNITIESTEEEEQEDSEPTPTPCPSPASQDEASNQEDENNYQEEEDTGSKEDSDEDWDDYWERKYSDEQDYWDEDVQGVKIGFVQLRNSQNSSFGSSRGGSSTFDGGAGTTDIEGGDGVGGDQGRDPCDSLESNSSGASSQFDGTETSGGVAAPDSAGDQGGEPASAPTNTAPDVEGVSTTGGGLFQLILNALFPHKK